MTKKLPDDIVKSRLLSVRLNEAEYATFQTICHQMEATMSNVAGGILRQYMLRLQLAEGPLRRTVPIIAAKKAATPVKKAKPTVKKPVKAKPIKKTGKRK